MLFYACVLPLGAISSQEKGGRSQLTTCPTRLRVEPACGKLHTPRRAAPEAGPGAGHLMKWIHVPNRYCRIPMNSEILSMMPEANMAPKQSIIVTRPT